MPTRITPSRRRLLRTAAGGLTLPVVAAGSAGAAPAPQTSTSAPPDDATVVDGDARFQVLTPTLLRVEYAADGAFEDRPTFVALDRAFETPAYETRVVDGYREIETDRLLLRYERDSGPFTPANLSVEVAVGDGTVTARPSWPTPDQHGERTTPVTVPRPEPDAEETATRDGSDDATLGGWYRALDNQGTPRDLHPGLLSRDGWRLVDDTHGALVTDELTPTPRPGRDGAYRDGYLFGYGHDYRRALEEFASLTGAPPLLPRKLFGNWFSRWGSYSASDYRDVVRRFREEDVPLSVLVVDTDWKAPHSWNGWNWNRDLFPDPEGFLDWAHDQELLVPLNVHPSIEATDPRFPEADRRAGGLPRDNGRGHFYAQNDAWTHVFDWADPDHRDAYSWLHDPFEAQGVDFWWFDWCCDESRSSMPGVSPDSQINALYAARQRRRDRRAFAFSRIGSSFHHEDASVPGPWAEHRQTVHFTGDTAPTWEMLDHEIYVTAAESAAIGLPYVSHDVGSFHGQHIPDDMYVRWVQFGTFQPILRLHSNHGDRLPWQYSPVAEAIAKRFLRLRGRLVPYLYTLARAAHDTGLPMVRAPYLAFPDHDAAYEYTRQYLLGADLLVAPIASPGPTATKDVWVPPGEWVDFFTGERYEGPGVHAVEAPLDRIPVFARAGGILPLRPRLADTGQGPVDPLELRVYAGDDGSLALYEDAGEGLGYRDGAYAVTPVAYVDRADGGRFVVEGADGRYPGMPGRRGYEVRFVDVDRPASVSVTGPAHGTSWTYDETERVLTVRVGRRPVDQRTRVSFREERAG